MTPIVITCLAALFVLLPADRARAQSSLEGQEKRVLNLTKSSWAHFRDFDGRQLIYFTHLESYRCAIGAVRYSLDSDVLDRQWQLQPCDPKNPNAIATDKPYISLPLGSAKTIAVELTFKDGSKSDIARIDANNKIVGAPAQ